MIVAISTCEKDYFECGKLLEWIRELNTYPRHRLLLVFGKKINSEQRMELINTANSCMFRNVTAIQQVDEDPRGWPYAPNQVFQLAMRWIEGVGRGPFLWLEPDAAPLKSGWLDDLEEEYLRIGKPFMGFIFDWVSATAYRPHLTGVAVYPPHFRSLNPYPLNATDTPWDVTRPDLTLPRTHRTQLIYHDWGDRKTNIPPAFHTVADLERIPKTAVIMHRCKDGTLIDRLREKRQMPVIELGPPPESVYAKLKTRPVKGLLSWPFPFFSPKKPGKERPILRVRRTGAFGDCIAATGIAIKLREMGYDTVFKCSPAVKPIVELSPFLRVVEDPEGACDIELDNAYEQNPDRVSHSFMEIFVDVANKQLRAKRIQIPNAVQCTPSLVVPEKWKALALDMLHEFPKPWVFICPRSNSHTNRTVHEVIWNQACSMIGGTKFWIGNHTQEVPPSIIDLGVKSMTDTMTYLSVADLLISVDSGPMHMAAAVGVPIIGLLQSSSPELHLSDQRDFEVLRPDNLTCLNCQKTLCPMDSDYPYCQSFTPEAIAAAANRKLRMYLHNDVSAVITAYKPTGARLNKAIRAVLPQACEVIVTFNADGVIPGDALQHPKVKYIKTRLPDIGYGRNANFGIRHTCGKYILLLNDDVYLNPGAVDKAMEVMTSREDVGLVGMLLRYPHDNTIQHAGTTRRNGDLGWGHVSHRKKESDIKDVTECENVTHAAALIRRKAFFDVKGYDERYYAYFEDNHLNLDLRRNGWKIFYTPFATGIHEEHQTISSLPTPAMVENLKKSRAIFERSWGEYFRYNRDVKLGSFDYLKDQ